jgi:hypothetical protein
VISKSLLSTYNTYNGSIKRSCKELPSSTLHVMVKAAASAGASTATGAGIFRLSATAGVAASIVTSYHRNCGNFRRGESPGILPSQL